MSAGPSRRRTPSLSAPRAHRRPCRAFARTGIESAASARVESCGSGAADFIEQPGAREPNIAMHGCRRPTERGGDLVVRQAAEIMQFDDMSQARFHLLESLDGVVERDDVEIHERRWGAHPVGHRCADAGVALYPRA